MTDYYAMDDAHALHLTRRIVANLNYIKAQQVCSCLRNEQSIDRAMSRY